MRSEILIVALLVGGCASSVDPSTYSVGSVGQINRSVAGNIVSAREITIDRNTGAAGTTGAALGAVGGSSIGGGDRANLAGAIGGAVAGALIGSAIEGSASATRGMEYVIATQTGALITVVQGLEPRFSENAAVIVLYGSPARVIADPRAP